jgi:hypothetical protein
MAWRPVAALVLAGKSAPKYPVVSIPITLSRPLPPQGSTAGSSCKLSGEVMSDDAWKTPLAGLGCAMGCDCQNEEPVLGLFFLAPIIGGIAAAASSAASVAAPVVAAVGSAAGAMSTAASAAGAVAATVQGGMQVADGLIKAATGSAPALSPEAIQRLRGGSAAIKANLKTIADQKKEREREAAAKKKAKEAGAKKLAEVMIRARKGDVEAQAIIAGLAIMTDPLVQRDAAIANFTKRFNQIPDDTLLFKFERSAKEQKLSKDWKSFVAEAKRIAESSAEWKSGKAAKMLFPVSNMKAAVTNQIASEVKKAAAKGNAKGASGFLVTTGGKIIRGKWLPA